MCRLYDIRGTSLDYSWLSKYRVYLRYTTLVTTVVLKNRKIRGHFDFHNIQLAIRTCTLINRSRLPVQVMIYSGKLFDQKLEVKQGRLLYINLGERYLDAGALFMLKFFVSTLDLSISSQWKLHMLKQCPLIIHLYQVVPKDRTCPVNNTLFGIKKYRCAGAQFLLTIVVR